MKTNVNETRYDAMFALYSLFSIDRIGDMAGFVPIILALQETQTDQELKECVGIIEHFFLDEHLDPKDFFQRSIAAAFSPVIAMSIKLHLLSKDIGESAKAKVKIVADTPPAQFSYMGNFFPDQIGNQDE